MFTNLQPPTFCFFCQPVVEFVAADHTQGMPLGDANIQTFGFKVKVNVIRIDMRNFGDIQTQPLEDDLCIQGQASGAKLEAWILFLFEKQAAGGKLRSDLLEVQGGGESTGSAADDDNVVIHC